MTHFKCSRKTARFIRAVGARVGATVKKLASCFRPRCSKRSPPSPSQCPSPCPPKASTTLNQKAGDKKHVLVSPWTAPPTPSPAATGDEVCGEEESLVRYDPFGPLPPRAPVNGGNTCYLDSVLVAMFAMYDGWDGLIHRLSFDCDVVKRVQAVVNTLRRGKVVQSFALNELRDCLILHAGWYEGCEQHDAAELLSLLLDALHAPFLPLFKNMSHRGNPNLAADHVPFTERVLWLNLTWTPAPSSLPAGRSSATTTNEGSVELGALVDSYFFGEVVHDLQRDIEVTIDDDGDERDGDGTRVSVPTSVDAKVCRSLIPGYTPVRETGEQSSWTASRETFGFMTVPFAVSRFDASGRCKDVRIVRVPTVLDASRYVGPFAVAGVTYKLMLRSVVCHLGESIDLGHYVTYTYADGGGWQRWDDMADGCVRSVEGDVVSGEPRDEGWATEIRRNCYLVFYELVPGDSPGASS